MNSNWWPSTKKEYGNEKLTFVMYQLHILKDLMPGGLEKKNI